MTPILCIRNGDLRLTQRSQTRTSRVRYPALVPLRYATGRHIRSSSQHFFSFIYLVSKCISKIANLNPGRENECVYPLTYLLGVMFPTERLIDGWISSVCLTTYLSIYLSIHLYNQPTTHPTTHHPHPYLLPFSSHTPPLHTRS